MIVDFYKSPEWRSVRKQALRLYGDVYMMCESTPTMTHKPPHADHILPRSVFPEYQLCIHNMQVLCEHCNCSIKKTKIIDARSKHHKKRLRSTFDDLTSINMLIKQHAIDVGTLISESNNIKDQTRIDRKATRIKRRNKNKFNLEQYNKTRELELENADKIKQRNQLIVEQSLAKANGLRKREQSSATITYKKQRTI